MTIRAVKGVIRNGRVEVADGLGAPDGTEVVVSVPVAADEGSARQMSFGMFAPDRGTPAASVELPESKQLWEREWERSWDRLEKQ